MKIEKEMIFLKTNDYLIIQIFLRLIKDFFGISILKRKDFFGISCCIAENRNNKYPTYLLFGDIFYDENVSDFNVNTKIHIILNIFAK